MSSCPSCSAEVAAEQAYCGACGHRLLPAPEAGALTDSAPLQEPDRSATQARARSHDKTVTGAGASGETLIDRARELPQSKVVASALAAVGLLAIGSIGPWATASYFGISSSVSGLHGGGWVTLITATAGGIAILNPRWLSRVPLLQRRRLGIWLGFLLLSVLVCFLNFVNVQNYGLSGVVHPGWGLYLAFVAALLGVGAAQILRVQAQTSV